MRSIVITSWRLPYSLPCLTVTCTRRFYSCHSARHDFQLHQRVDILGQKFETDNMTNITPSILNRIGKSLHNQEHHPIHLIRNRIQHYFYSKFVSRTGKPIFAVLDNLSPIVTLKQNFDSLLVPADHPSREPKVGLLPGIRCLVSVRMS